MIKTLFIILVFALLVYSGVLLATPYYHYYAFKSDVEEFAEAGFRINPQQLKEQVISMANSYNIPLEDKDVVITRNDKTNIEVYWQETVNIFNIYTRTFEFFIDTSG